MRMNSFVDCTIAEREALQDARDTLIAVYVPEAEYLCFSDALKLAIERDAEAAMSLYESVLANNRSQLHLAEAAKVATTIH